MKKTAIDIDSVYELVFFSTVVLILSAFANIFYSHSGDILRYKLTAGFMFLSGSALGSALLYLLFRKVLKASDSVILEGFFLASFYIYTKDIVIGMIQVISQILLKQ